jgi:hypothetical protein
MTEIVLYLPAASTSSVVVTPDGRDHLVKIDEIGRRFVEDIEPEQARLMLNSGLPSSLELWAANVELAAALGRPP